MWKRWWLGFAGALLVLSGSAAALADATEKFIDRMRSASELVKAYVALEAPTPDDLEKLLAEPVVRNYGAQAVNFLLIIPGLLTQDGRLPESFDPDDNVRLFKLLEVLVQTPSAPPADDPDEALSIKIRDRFFSPENNLAAGLTSMIEMYAAVQEPDRALEYYARLQALPKKPMLDLSRANAIQTLVGFYGDRGDLSSAMEIYGDFTGLARSPGIQIRRGETVVRLVEALAGAGRLREAERYDRELDKLTRDEFVEKHKVQADKALAAGYRKSGDLKKAEELETRIKAEEERLRIADEESRAAMEKMMELFRD